ncbi:MAG: glycerol-3-phosphate acyltransferase, partial [Veillonella sp.]|nr:glycerol-3-phosphate acyltransferase [Veillonella sp.]
MSGVLPLLAMALLAYLVGSIPSGLIIGKGIFATDVRQFGSKNIGATNTYRVLGLKAA